MGLQVPSKFLKCGFDLFYEVCSYLPQDDQIAMDIVAEKANAFWLSWTLYSKSLRLREYVKQHGFGASKWEHYFGKVERIPLPLKLFDVLKSRCPFFPGKKVEDTHILFLLPKTVDEKPLTLNSLGELVEKPKKGSCGNPTQYLIFSDKVKDLYGNQTTDKSCWVLMTRGVIPKNKNQSLKALNASIPLGGQGYAIPKGLEAAAGAFLRYVAAGERLFPDPPLMYTCCQELTRYGDRVIVGGFGASGLDVDEGPWYGARFMGFAVLRKFSGT